MHKFLNEKRETIYYRINNLLEFTILKLGEDNHSLYLNSHKKDDIISIIKKSTQDKSQNEKLNFKKE